MRNIFSMRVALLLAKFETTSTTARNQLSPCLISTVRVWIVTAFLSPNLASSDKNSVMSSQKVSPDRASKMLFPPRKPVYPFSFMSFSTQLCTPAVSVQYLEMESAPLVAFVADLSTKMLLISKRVPLSSSCPQH